MSKYEQLIEFIINEQEEQARELFHQIVVAKSREIYESLIDETDIGGNAVEQLADEVTMDEEGMAEGEDEEGEIELGGEEDMGDDHHADVGGEEELEDRVMDLEDALEELKAEFDALMADEAGEEEHQDGMTDPDFGDEEAEEVMYEDSMEAEEEDAMSDSEEDLEESKQGRKMTEAEWIREYVEKVNNGFPGNNSETSEVGTGGTVSLNKQSTVAGKNDMGGKVVGGSPAEADVNGKTIEQPNNEYSKGKGQLKGAGQFKNVPGSKGDSFKAKAPAATKNEVAGTNEKSPVAK